jgi:hypothetical protein
MFQLVKHKLDLEIIFHQIKPNLIISSFIIHQLVQGTIILDMSDKQLMLVKLMMQDNKPVSQVLWSSN